MLSFQEKPMRGDTTFQVKTLSMPGTIVLVGLPSASRTGASGRLALLWS